MNKRLAIAAAVFCVTTFAISAEGQGDGSSGAAKKPVTLSVMLSQGWLKEPEKALAAKFEEETGIKVDYQVIPSAQYFNVLMTKLMSGQGTDVFGSQSGAFDIVSQLNIEKNGVDLSGEEWVSRMDPLVREQVTAGGKVYGLSIIDTAPGFPILYNKKIFAKLGLSVPKSYAEFKDVCAKILASGVTPIFEPVADGWHHVLWFCDIGPRYEEASPGLTSKLNTNKAKFQDSAAMETALAQMKELADLGYFGANYLSDSGSNTATFMGNGSYAMTLAGLGYPAQIAKTVPEAKAEDYGFFEIPLADNQILCLGTAGPSRFIYSQSTHIAEAKSFLAYLARPASLQYQLDNSETARVYSFSGLKDRLSDDHRAFIASYPKRGTYYQIQVKYLNPQWMEIGKDMVAMFLGQETPKDVLKNIDKRRADQAKAAKDPAWN